MEVIPEEQQLPAQRSAASVMAGRAARAWWAPRHPGWMILTLGGRHFSSLDEVMLVRHSASPRLQPVTMTIALDLDTDTSRAPARSNPILPCLRLLSSPCDRRAIHQRGSCS